jgi:peptidoglycan/LPS O-acetylase OafA/YrhL
MQKKDPISGLDGLRALAALAVFGVHYNQIVQFSYHIGPFSIYRLFGNGNHGVSLFFSLSGFLLSLPFWGAIASGDQLPSLKVYTLRRIARILPAYYLALTALVILTNLWRVPGAKIDILLHYTFLFNYTEFSIFSINPPFWTLAVEVQFYILLPFIILLIRRISFLNPLWVIFVLGIGAYVMHYFLISSVTRIIPWPYNPWLTWIRPYGAVLSHSLLAHLPHFLIGMAAGKLYRHINKIDVSNKRIQSTSEAVFWICLTATIVLLGTGFIEKIAVPYGRYGFPLVPLLLATTIFTAPMTRIAKLILDGLLLRKLGIISYGIYIYHLPCLNLVDRYMSRFGLDASEHWILFGFIGIVLSVLIAAVSFIAIEKPIMKLAKRIR